MDEALHDKLFAFIRNDEELNTNDVVRKFGKTELSNIKTKLILMYNLDLILAVGYKINLKKGIEFRKWANKYSNH